MAVARGQAAMGSHPCSFRTWSLVCTHLPGQAWRQPMLLLGLPTRGSSTCLNLRAALVVSPEQHDWGNDTAM